MLGSLGNPDAAKGWSAAPASDARTKSGRRADRGTTGAHHRISPRLCWQVAGATLTGPRITASLAMPGIDWIRIDSNGIRRQDQRTQFLTDDGTLIPRGIRNSVGRLARG